MFCAGFGLTCATRVKAGEVIAMQRSRQRKFLLYMGTPKIGDFRF